MDRHCYTARKYYENSKNKEKVSWKRVEEIYIAFILSDGQMLSFIYIWKSGVVNLVRIYFLK